MNSRISVRTSDNVETGLQKADFSRSGVVRVALRNKLIDQTVGVCAISGNRCYPSSFATIGATTPLGDFLDIPDHLGRIDLDDEYFDKAARTHSTSPESEYEATYLERIGPSTYKAECKYLAACNTSNDVPENWARLHFNNDDVTDLEYGVLRVVYLLEWIKTHNPEHNAISLEAVWSEQPDGIQSNVTERAIDNDGTPIYAALDEIGVICSD